MDIWVALGQSTSLLTLPPRKFRSGSLIDVKFIIGIDFHLRHRLELRLVKRRQNWLQRAECLEMCPRVFQSPPVGEALLPIRRDTVAPRLMISLRRRLDRRL